MNQHSFQKNFTLLFFLFSITFFINGCKKENEIQSPNPDPRSKLMSFANQHLPAEKFYQLNWKSLKPVLKEKTTIGWIVYPEKQGNEKTSYFILAQKDSPIEIIYNQITLKKEVASGFDVEQIDQTSLVKPKHIRVYSNKVENESNSGRSKLSKVCDNCPTLPDVVIVAKRRKKTVYTDSDPWFEQHTSEEGFYFPIHEEDLGGGGSGSGGSSGGGSYIYDETDQEDLEYLDPSSLTDFVLFNNLYLYTPDYYPGIETGFPWRWWQNVQDLSWENLGAAFFNIENLRLSLPTGLWLTENKDLSIQTKLFIEEKEFETEALISAKTFVEVARQNLLNTAIGSQQANILQASYNEFACCLTNPINPSGYAADITVRIAYLKKDHPNWSLWKCYLEAHRDMIHFGLDILGMIPVGGEVFDVINGIIYTVEGDGISAGLSLLRLFQLLDGWLLRQNGREKLYIYQMAAELH